MASRVSRWTNRFVAQNISLVDPVAPYVAAVCYFDLHDGDDGMGGVRRYGVYNENGAEKPAVAEIQDFLRGVGLVGQESPTGAEV